MPVACARCEPAGPVHVRRCVLCARVVADGLKEASGDRSPLSIRIHAQSGSHRQRTLLCGRDQRGKPGQVPGLACNERPC